MCGIALVADSHGRRTHDIVEQALGALVRLTHRGAPAATASIDGAGILTQIPWPLLADDLPAVFSVETAAPRALGCVFMPRRGRVEARTAIERILAGCGFDRIAWRAVPISFDAIDADRRAGVPAVLQVAAIGRMPADEAEAALYRARVRIDAELAAKGHDFSLVSLSTRTVVYKGLLTPSELPRFYLDLREPHFRSAVAIVHQRFSTNTVARWALAQPFHLLAHNGEISTIEGNRRWAGARLRASGIPTNLGSDLDRRCSDSCSLDAAAHALAANGLTLPQALARLVPPAWEEDETLDPYVAAFYEHQSTFSEPWDGPAAVAFSDGTVAGALLDRNGFRPARYVRTRDGRLFLGSEAGIFDVPEQTIVSRRRLGPGGMVLVDMRSGDVLETAAVRLRLARSEPHRALVTARIVPHASLQPASSPAPRHATDLARMHRVFGYTQEEIDVILRPMARDGHEAIGSMGDDAPLAPLSRLNRLLPDSFRQRFAQVTNPSMDPLRERCVMSLRTLIGPGPMVSLRSPVLDDDTFGRLAAASVLKPAALALAFEADEDGAGLGPRVDELCQHAVDAVSGGARLLILTDRDLAPECAAVPPLLAVAAVHEALLAAGLLTRAAIVVETGEVRDAHQLAVLAAFGAAAVFPYLALETAAALAEPADREAARRRYAGALEEGLLKILSKMGVTTFSGYCGGGLFDAIGLAPSFASRFFRGAAIAGSLTLDELARGALMRHREAVGTGTPTLRYPGVHSFRRSGEQHAFEPAVVRQLHKAAGDGSPEAYRAFVALVDARPPIAPRDLLDWTPRKPTPIDDVEPAAAIVRRFFSAAMSIGALSPEAHETLAVAMNRIGGRSNSGEGGEPADRFRRRDGRPWRGSAIKQVASARFGVTPAYLRSADELQIKIAQGSKPGEGGQLPAVKVVEHIAALRHAQPGIALISPPVHHDIYSIEDLAQLIFDLRRLHPSARISVKLVSASGVGLVAAGAAKAGADAILISGHDGGTGASPRGSIKHAGLPWEFGLAEGHRALTAQGLRNRVALQVDGGLQRGRDVAMAAALGADEFGFGTAALAAIGCVMARQCHLDTCPAGIATQRPDLRRRYAGTPEMAIAFLTAIAEDVRSILASLGLREIAQLVGRTDLLAPRSTARSSPTIDIASILEPAGRRSPRTTTSAHVPPAIDDVDLPDSLHRGGTLVIRGVVRNVDRTVGAALAGRITEQFGDAGLTAGSVVLKLTGAAGQSVGAFLVPGMEIDLRGEANDYVGKGMRGGTLSIACVESERADRDVPVLAGNAALYGATGGRLFVAGAAGERFAVRNSGATAVVEEIGDHGCEYMTGGTVVLLGRAGRNFASGMSGGVVYARCDLGGGAAASSAASPLGPGDWQRLESLLSEHWKRTGSATAAALLGGGAVTAALFRKFDPAATVRAAQSGVAAPFAPVSAGVVDGRVGV